MTMATSQVELSVPRRSRRIAQTICVYVPLATALCLWRLSLSTIHLSSLGSSGLPGILPIAWYLALALLVCGATAAIWTGHWNPWLVLAYLAALIAILYATVPWLSPVPQYAWTYKHIGVTNLIAATGSFHPSVDIYNRWPGFFALAAFFSRLTGIDPIALARWAEPFFVVMAAMPIAAIARVLARDARVAASAALLFVVTNWVGQSYFSPQAMAYALDLALVLVILRQLSTEEVVGKLGKRLVNAFARLVRRPPASTLPTDSPRWSQWVSLTVALALDAAIVVTHQLTPIFVILQVAALIAIGTVRPRWLVLAFAAMTIAYALPNLRFVTSNYGLFTGLNPFHNMDYVLSVPLYRASWQPNTGKALSYLGLGLAVLAFFRLVRVGQARGALVLAALAVSPFALLLGQNYGGEAPLRIFLFSNPWRDIAIAWAIVTFAPSRRFWVAVPVLVAFAALLVPAFLGNATTNVIPPDEVTASEYFYNHAPPGSVLMLAGADFPLRVSARYAQMSGPMGDATPNLMADPRFATRVLGPKDLPAIIAAIRYYSRNGFLVFSATQMRYSEIFHVNPVGALAALERTVEASPRFRLWYSTKDARIFELVGDPADQTYP